MTLREKTERSGRSREREAGRHRGRGRTRHEAVGLGGWQVNMGGSGRTQLTAGGHGAGRPVPGEQRPPLDGGDVRDGPGVSSVQPGLQGGGHEGPAGGRRQVLGREGGWRLGDTCKDGGGVFARTCSHAQDISTCKLNFTFMLKFSPP